MKTYRYRIKEVRSINKKGEISEREYYVQKRFLLFWREVKFYDLYSNASLLWNVCYVHPRVKSFSDITQVKNAVKTLEKFKSKKYNGKKIKIGIKDHEVVYFYDFKTEYHKNLGIWFRTIDGLKDYLDKSTIKKKKEYTYIIF